MIDKFREKLKKDGRSVKWFHANYIKQVLNSYPYFIIQLSDTDRMHEDVEKIIKKYMAE
jgi:hypothetical protein